MCSTREMAERCRGHREGEARGHWDWEANCYICYIFAARPLPAMDDFHLVPAQVELHVHLDGSFDSGVLFRAAQKHLEDMGCQWELLCYCQLCKEAVTRKWSLVPSTFCNIQQWKLRTTKIEDRPTMTFLSLWHFIAQHLEVVSSLGDIHMNLVESDKCCWSLAVLWSLSRTEQVQLPSIAHGDCFAQPASLIYQR